MVRMGAKFLLEKNEIIESYVEGAFHTVKEFDMALKTTLAGVKEHMSGIRIEVYFSGKRIYSTFHFEADNSELICAEACKDSIYILANNHGIKSPEEFGILVCNHFLSKYRDMTNVCLTVEDFTWNRISYDGSEAVESKERLKLHNHAFVHGSECLRTCSVTLNRKGLKVFFQGNFQFVAR